MNTVTAGLARLTARLPTAAGLKPLLLGDVEAGTLHMQPIHRFLADSVVFANDRRRLDGLEPNTRAALLAVVAGYLPYYTSEAQVGPCHAEVAHPVRSCARHGASLRLLLGIMIGLHGVLRRCWRVSCPAPEQGLSSAMESFPSPSHTLDQGGHRAGEAADYGERAMRRSTLDAQHARVTQALISPSPCSRVAGVQRPAHAQRGARPVALPERPTGAHCCGYDVNLALSLPSFQ